MAIIRASCPDCGDIELTVHDMVVRVCDDDERGAYVFRCPECHMAVTKHAETRIVDLLVTAGVALQRWHLPAELIERRPSEPLTHDHLLEFHALLEDDDWLARLAASEGL